MIFLGMVKKMLKWKDFWLTIEKDSPPSTIDHQYYEHKSTVKHTAVPEKKQKKVRISGALQDFFFSAIVRKDFARYVNIKKIRNCQYFWLRNE